MLIKVAQWELNASQEPKAVTIRPRKQSRQSKNVT